MHAVRPLVPASSAVLLPALLVAALLPLLGGCGTEPAPPPAPHVVGFATDVRPVMADYCVGCHGGERPDGGMSFDAWVEGDETPDFETLRERTAFFERLAHHVMNGSMPPEGQPAPEDDARAAMVAWFRDTLTEAWRVASPDPGRVTMRRLSRVEYRNTVRDLLGVDYDTTETFPTDDVGYGFDHIGDVLSMPPILLEKYLDAAETIAAAAVPLPVWRHEAERLKLKGGARVAGGEVTMYSNGEAFGEVSVRDTADYRLRVRVRAQQAGDQQAQVHVHFGALLDERFFVEARTGVPYEKTFTLRIPAGRHRVRLAFTNDHYAPKHPDPAQRDRNLFLDWFELERRGLPEQARMELRPDAVLACLPAPGEERICAETLLAPLLKRAFRRPATPAELEGHVGLVMDALEAGESYEGAIQTALQAILVSPHFLFRVELDEAAGGEARPLDDHELASRLSYFLWASCPDDVLLAAADAGALRPAIHEHVTRMLADPRASSLVTNFAAQWLELRRLDTAVPDRRRFPEVTDAMRGWMRRETELFVEAIIREDRSVLDLIDAPFTFVNEPLAKFYGIDGVKGGAFRRVDVDPATRGGLLGHASILTLTSYPHRTSPVLRGKWILEELLGAPPPPPPPGVGTLEAQAPAMLKLSVRERLAAHREDPSCAVCHDGMDNLGYGLENYDAVGAWREAAGTHPIDAGGVLPGGRRFDGPAALKQILRADPGVPRCVAEKLLTYALGRGLEPYDRPAVLQIVEEAQARRWRFSAFVHAVVATDAFTMRRTRGDAP